MYKAGANRQDKNKICKLAMEGHSVEQIQALTLVRVEQVKAVVDQFRKGKLKVGKLDYTNGEDGDAKAALGLGGGGADVLSGAGGDDVISIADGNFTSVDGGDGYDRLILNGDDISLDLSRVSSVEEIQLSTKAQGNSLNLALNDVMGTSDNMTMTLLGDSEDTVRIFNVDGWQNTGNVSGFDVYQSSGVTLSVEENIAVILV